jgi:hypothetical protein
MASPQGIFELYHRGQPPKIEVWCGGRFRQETGALFRASSAADKAHFANVNELINRFARGERLSELSFRKEDIGYAFKSGALRFYGVFSAKRGHVFVLSHAILKRHEKLGAADVRRMQECRQAFDLVS